MNIFTFPFSLFGCTLILPVFCVGGGGGGGGGGVGGVGLFKVFPRITLGVNNANK